MARPTLSYVLVILVVPIAIALMLWQPLRAHNLVVTVCWVPSAPQTLDDPIWKQAREVQIPVKGRDLLADEEGMVAMRALYTDDRIYVLFRWQDPTRSVIKQSWQYDGVKWRHLEGNEDRIALLFEITRIDKFATRGCAITCHSPADLPREKWRFATRTAAQKGDLWHWKAARSAPYHYADDAWLTVAGNPSGSYRATGRRKDRGAGGDLHNETTDKSKPLYMQDPQKAASAPGFLLFEEAVKIDNYAIFNAGDVIPYRLPLKPSGSRYDVQASSRYEEGFWTVMLSRRLNTGHEDDLVFNPLKKYSFAIAVFDDSGADHSKATLPLALEFER